MQDIPLLEPPWFSAGQNRPSPTATHEEQNTHIYISTHNTSLASIECVCLCVYQVQALLICRAVGAITVQNICPPPQQQPARRFRD